VIVMVEKGVCDESILLRRSIEDVIVEGDITNAVESWKLLDIEIVHSTANL